MKGSISCQCGEVRLEIGDAIPKMRLQCGCCDCRQAMAWAQRKGGPKVPSTRPLDLWYFENDILISSGKGKLKWFKLRKDGKSLRWVAQCCYTTMIVHHPTYKNKVFMVYADAVKLSDEIPKLIQPVVRAQMKEYPKYKVSELVKFPGGTSVDKECTDMDALSDYGQFENRQGFLKALKEGIVCVTSGITNPIGKTSRDHFEEDGNVTTLGLTECEDLRASYVFKFI